MQTKVSKAVEHFNNGNVKEALKIAKGFKLGLSKDDRGALSRGYECITNPSFYVQLKKDPEAEISRAIEVFRKNWCH